MSLPIIVRPVADAEFVESIDHYKQVGEAVARDFARTIDDVIREVALTPKRYPIVEGDVREAPVGGFPFAVYYRVRANRLIVLAIYHQSRDPSGWKTRS